MGNQLDLPQPRPQPPLATEVRRPALPEAAGPHRSTVAAHAVDAPAGASACLPAPAAAAPAGGEAADAALFGARAPPGQPSTAESNAEEPSPKSDVSTSGSDGEPQPSVAIDLDGSRPRIDRATGEVAEPASGVFSAEVGPGDDLQAALDSCGEGNSVLLLPGVHVLPRTLIVDREVHLFGRNQALIRTAAGDVVRCTAPRATIDGVSILREAGGELEDGAVSIRSGNTRLQNCEVQNLSRGGAVDIAGVEANPTIASCGVHDSAGAGVQARAGAHGLVVGNDLQANRMGVELRSGADVTVIDNVVRDSEQTGISVIGSSVGTLQTTGEVAHNEVVHSGLDNVAIRNSADPAVVANVVHASAAGTGVLVTGEGTTGEIKANDVHTNDSSGVEVRAGAAPTVEANQLHDNHGAGLVFDGGSGVARENLVWGNQTFGVVLTGGSRPVLEGNVISNTAAPTCGILLLDSPRPGPSWQSPRTGTGHLQEPRPQGERAALLRGNVFSGNTAGDLVSMQSRDQKRA